MPSPGSTAAAPFFIVINAGSGRNDAVATRDTIVGVMKEAGREHEIAIVEDAGALAGTARAMVDRAKARAGIVVVAGGDGTINAVAQATLGSGCPFGVLPQGTFNYFSRTHSIPADTAEATRLLLTAHVMPVQAGLVNDHVFLVNASLGLYPQLLQDREAHKKQFGRSRVVAVASALATLFREHRQLRIELEQGGEVRRVRTPTLFVGNNRLQMEQTGIPDAETLDAGRLMAIMLKPVGSLKLLWLLLRGAWGTLGEAGDVISFDFKRMIVKPALPYGRRRIKVATDGEVTWMNAPLVFSVAPEPLLLLVPPPGTAPPPA
jgi:diacylglycerol kinase family enzyme